MATDWNPNSPEVAGLEWRLTEGHWAGVSRSPVRGLRFASTQAASIDDARFRVRDTGLTGPTYRALLEVFEDGDELVSAPVQTLVCPPNADDGANSTISTSAWNKGPITPGDITDLWQYIDEPVTWPPTGNWINDAIWQEATTNEPYAFWVDTSALPATARILRVRSRAVGYAFTLGGTYSNRPFGFRLLHRPSGEVFTPPGGSGFLVSLYTTLAEHDYGEINPVTGLPWTPADMAEFDGGDWACRVTTFSTAGTASVLVRYELCIDYVDPENRVAVGTWARPSVQATALVTTDDLVAMPAGTGAWAKPSSGQFVAGLRIAHDTLTYPSAPANANTRWLAGSARVTLDDPIEAPADTVYEGQVYTLDTYGLYRTAADADSRIPSILFRAAGVVDTDSQIYAVHPDIDTAEVTGGMAEVTSARTVGQRFAAPATDTFLGVTFPLLCATPSTDATVTVQIRRVSDNVQMGGTYTLTTAEFLALPAIEQGGDMRLVPALLDAAASLVSATVYEARVSVDGGTWRIPIADCEGAGSAGFGGTTGCLVYNGGTVPVTDTDADLPLTITQQPDAPINVSAAVTRIPTRRGIDCFCEVNEYQAVLVRWQQPAMPTFDFLTIERYLDTGDPAQDWHLVAITPYEVDYWVDREVPYGVGATYRLTNFVLGGAFSTPVLTQPVVPEATGCSLVVTSNAQPDLTVVYGHEPLVDYDFLDFAADRILPIDGADFQIVLRETERRGTAWTTRVIAHFGRQPCDDTGRPIGGAAVFDPLVDAARWAGAPYVCVLDHEGNRTLGYLEVGRGTRNMPGWRYHAALTATPLTATPIPVDLR